MEEEEDYKDGSDGSAERLLGETNPEHNGDDEDDEEEEEDEDDIAKLMGFKDNESDTELSEGRDKRSRRSVLKYPKSETQLEDTDGVSLKVVRIESIPERIDVTPYVPSTKPLSAVVLKRKRQMERMYAKHNSQTSKMVCGLLCMVVILGIGGGLLFFAITLGMADLYIIGGIFAGGGILFTLSFIILRCTEENRISFSDYSALYKSSWE